MRMTVFGVFRHMKLVLLGVKLVFLNFKFTQQFNSVGQISTKNRSLLFYLFTKMWFIVFVLFFNSLRKNQFHALVFFCYFFFQIFCCSKFVFMLKRKSPNRKPKFVSHKKERFGP